MENNLTSENVFKNIVSFSLPYLLSYFLQTLYGMADLFIIGQFEGPAGTTAVSIGSQIMHMLTVMIVGLAMGTTVTIGQAVGHRSRRSEACVKDGGKYGSSFSGSLCDSNGCAAFGGETDRCTDVYTYGGSKRNRFLPGHMLSGNSVRDSL